MTSAIRKEVAPISLAAFIILVGLVTIGVMTGPDWIWTGCIDLGPSLHGCGQVFPIGTFGVVLIVAVVYGLAMSAYQRNHD